MSTIEVLSTADWRIDVSIVDKNDDPIDLTGAQFRATFKTTEGTVIGTVSSGNGIEITDPANGEITITLSIAARGNFAVTENVTAVVDVLRLALPGEPGEYVEWSGRMFIVIIPGVTEWTA